MNGIKHGKVNFKKYRNNYGISPTVMKDSQIYKGADKNVQDYIDFAGNIEINLKWPWNSTLFWWFKLLQKQKLQCWPYKFLIIHLLAGLGLKYDCCPTLVTSKED